MRQKMSLYLQHLLKHLKQVVQHFCRRFQLHPSAVKSTSQTKNYFKQASSWADDVYLAAIVARNRYRLSFLGAIVVIFMLLICLIMLIPLQHLEPLLIHHYQDGRVYVQPMSSYRQVKDSGQLENDIVRYIINRESYDPIAYEEQYRLILMLSAPAIADMFEKEQNASNPKAMINILANTHYRTVHIDDVVILDQSRSSNDSHQHHRNLAEVHFVVTDHQLSNGASHSHPYTALLSWAYQHPSTDPEVRWRNWDGFEITHYQKNQRSLSKEKT